MNLMWLSVAGEPPSLGWALAFVVIGVAFFVVAFVVMRSLRRNLATYATREKESIHHLPRLLSFVLFPYRFECPCEFCEVTRTWCRERPGRSWRVIR